MPQADMVIRRVLVFLALVLCMACGEHDVSRSRDGLVVMPGGKISARQAGDEPQDDNLKYVVSNTQANDVIKWVATELAKRSWTPLAGDWSDGSANSFGDGWSCHPDSQKRTVYVWVGDWVNRHGDVVTYSFATPDRAAPSDTAISATIIGRWNVKKTVPAVGEPNQSLSKQCMQFLTERR